LTISALISFVGLGDERKGTVKLLYYFIFVFHLDSILLIVVELSDRLMDKEEKEDGLSPLVHQYE